MKHTLDYSALNEPLKKADVTAYKQSGLYDRLPVANVIAVIIFVSIGLIIALTAIDEFLREGFTESTSVSGALIAALTFATWRTLEGSTKRRARLYKFARHNNLTFLVDSLSPGYAGMIFDNGHSRQIDDGLRFGDGTEIGNYTYVTGSGKSQRTHDWAYVKVKLARRLPHMVLDAKGNNFWRFSNLSDTFDRSQTLALEGNFNEYFTLYAPKRYERDALYVFTPDVMAAMVEYGQEYDIEIVDDELFIYGSRHFPLDKPEFYSRILTIIDTVGSELRDQTGYYADERVDSRAANIIAPQGRRLKSGFNWFIVVVILIIVYFTIIQPLLFR